MVSQTLCSCIGARNLAGVNKKVLLPATCKELILDAWNGSFHLRLVELQSPEMAIYRIAPTSECSAVYIVLHELFYLAIKICLKRHSYVFLPFNQITRINLG